MPEPIPFVKSVAETIKVSVELEVIYVWDIGIQATRSDSVLRWVLKVNITIPHLSPVARISRVPHLVPPSEQRPNKLYALQSRLDQESSLNMVTSTLQVYHLHVYVFLDPGASLFFVIPYIAIDFGVSS